MLVVADASPIIVLANIQCFSILPVMYGQVWVPRQIIRELSSPLRTSAVKDLMASRPAWLIERQPVSLLAIPDLDPGESAAISLAVEIGAHLLLIDESDGRMAARNQGLKIAGVIGVLEAAADQNLVQLSKAFADIKTDFWISHAFLDERLKLFQDRQKNRGTS